MQRRSTPIEEVLPPPPPPADPARFIEFDDADPTVQEVVRDLNSATATPRPPIPAADDEADDGVVDVIDDGDDDGDDGDDVADAGDGDANAPPRWGGDNRVFLALAFGCFALAMFLPLDAALGRFLPWLVRAPSAAMVLLRACLAVGALALLVT